MSKMDIRALADTRAQCAAKLESLSGFGDSKDVQERAAYYLAKGAYERAEREFRVAISTLTAEELAKLGIVA